MTDFWRWNLRRGAGGNLCDGAEGSLGDGAEGNQVDGVEDNPGAGAEGNDSCRLPHPPAPQPEHTPRTRLPSYLLACRSNRFFHDSDSQLLSCEITGSVNQTVRVSSVKASQRLVSDVHTRACGEKLEAMSTWELSVWSSAIIYAKGRLRPRHYDKCYIFIVSARYFENS